MKQPVSVFGFLIFFMLLLVGICPAADITAVVLGPYVAHHFLDRTELNRSLDSLGVDDFRDGQYSVGMGFRTIIRYLLLEAEVEGYQNRRLGDQADVSIYDLDILFNAGFNLFPPTKWKFYLLAGLGPNYSDINLSGKGNIEDSDASRWSLLGNAGFGGDIIVTKPMDKRARMGLSLFFRAGYQGEMYKPDWSTKIDGDPDMNFDGWYIRIGLGPALLTK